MARSAHPRLEFLAPGWFAVVVGWGGLALFSGLRLQRHAADWLADVRHPVRHPVLALVPMAMLMTAGFAILTLALASVIIGWLTLATARGLRDGSLLAPEPVALIHAV